MSGGGHPARVHAVAVDLSCSGLVVASTTGSAVLTPAVAPADRVGHRAGRVECSDRVDALAARDPSACVPDPCAWVDHPRVDVAGLSVPVREVLAAPLDRAAAWAGGVSGTPVVVTVPSHWGTPRIARVEEAARHRGMTVTTLRAALVTAEALSAAGARWIVCVEGMRTGWVLTLVRRERVELSVVDRRFVHVVDPVRDLPGDRPLRRVVDAASELRRSHRAARTGSFEVLARGVGASALVDECDRARVPSFVVAPEVTAETAVGLAPGPV